MEVWVVKKQKTKKFLITAAVIFGILFGFWAFLHFGLKLGTWKGTSYEVYKEHAYRGFFYEDLPAGAQDFRFQCSKFGLAARSAAAFTLKGEDYKDFITHVADMKRDDYYDTQGFEGKKVSETLNEYNDYGDYVGFPKSGFQYVIDDEISEYVILYYDAYRGAGASIYAIVANPENGRIIIFNYASN